MTNQSGLQSFIQNMQGTHTAGQANVPSSANNGNPNTVYNWSSYKPSVSQGANGLPTVNFDLITSQAPASSPGYATPFTADPYAAALLAGMPRASSTNSVNQILGNMFGGGNGGGFTPNPSGPGTGGPQTPPTPTTPTTPNTPTGPIGNGGRPIGPISGPIDRSPTSWQANYANAMPNTNLTDSGLGRTAALPWAQTPAFQQAANQPSTGNLSLDGLRTALDGVSNALGGVGQEVKAEWRDLLDNLSGRNGWQGVAREALNAFFPGLGELIPQQPNEQTAFNPEEDAATARLVNERLGPILAGISARGGADALARLQSQTSGRTAQQIYNSAPQMSGREWGRLQEQFNFANMFQQGRAGDIGSQLMAEAEERVRKTQERRGNAQK